MNVTSDGSKGAFCSHISQHMVKSLSEQEKSHSWRFEPQRSETFSRVADLRINYNVEKDLIHDKIVFLIIYKLSFDIAISNNKE